jgi:hypothetical protein
MLEVFLIFFVFGGGVLVLRAEMVCIGLEVLV